MRLLRRAIDFSTGNARIPFCGEGRFQWSCPACGVSGTVEASDDVDRSSEAIKADHNLVPPDYPHSRHVLDVDA
jgi:hypothetical protein